jgi:Family of unknown function (DUF5334)
MKTTCFTILFIFFLSFAHAFDWDGYDLDTEDYIEVENSALVIPGQDIEIYDNSDETYHDVYVISLKWNGTVVIEVFDHDTRDYRTFKMMDEIKAQESAFFLKLKYHA